MTSMQLKAIATILLGPALCVSVWAQDRPKLAQLTALGDTLSVDGFWERMQSCPPPFTYSASVTAGKRGTLSRLKLFV